MAFRVTAPPVVVCALLLAACSGSERWNFGASPASTPEAQPQAAAPQAKPPVNLAGRWTLSAPSGGSCAVTFGASGQEATEGTIAPGGGCPLNFFTSRKWSYSEGGLTMRDHNAQALVQLAPAGPNRFEGRTGSGQDVVLSR